MTEDGPPSLRGPPSMLLLLGPASGRGDDGAGGGDVVVVVPDDPLVGVLDAGLDGGLALRLGVDVGVVGAAGRQGGRWPCRTRCW